MTSDPAYEAICKAKRQAESANVEGALKTLEDYLATDPHNVKPRLQLANIIFYHLKDVGYGKMQLDIILDLEPDNVEAMKAFVTVMSQYKKYNDETDAMFAKLLEKEPSSEMYNMYAVFLRKQICDFERSAQYYEKAIAMNPGCYDYHLNYAVLLLNDIRDYVKAKEELELLLEMRPGEIKIQQNYDRLMKSKFDKNGNVKKKRFSFSHR